MARKHSGRRKRRVPGKRPADRCSDDVVNDSTSGYGCQYNAANRHCNRRSWPHSCNHVVRNHTSGLAIDRQIGNELMADLSDVEDALVHQVAAALYPHGFDEPSAVGNECRIYRGWPHAGALTTDLAAGRINVAVFPSAESGRITTRYASVFQSDIPAITLQSVSEGNNFTLSGIAQAGVLVGVQINRSTYSYRIEASDTIDLVAAHIAALISVDFLALVSGSRVEIPAAYMLRVRIAAEASMKRECRRQEHDIHISCWCPNPMVRDFLSTKIDLALSKIHFLALVDGSQARLVSKGAKVFDQSQSAMLFRRDIILCAEYATIEVDIGPPMLFGDLGVNAIEIVA